MGRKELPGREVSPEGMVGAGMGGAVSCLRTKAEWRAPSSGAAVVMQEVWIRNGRGEVGVFH